MLAAGTTLIVMRSAREPEILYQENWRLRYRQLYICQEQRLNLLTFIERACYAIVKDVCSY